MNSKTKLKFKHSMYTTRVEEQALRPLSIRHILWISTLALNVHVHVHINISYMYMYYTFIVKLYIFLGIQTLDEGFNSLDA